MGFGKQYGFTLVEMLVTMAIGMVILAGMTSVFVSQTRLSNMMNNKTEAMGDLYLASQIMQSELRGAQRICQRGGGKQLIYIPLDSNTNPDPANPCPSGGGEDGKFEYLVTASNPRICWKRPNVPGKKYRCDELIRQLMDVGGMRAVEDVYGVWTITLAAKYLDRDRQPKSLDLAFKVWPRN